MFQSHKQGIGKMKDLSSQLTSYLNLSQNPKPLQLIYSTSPSWPFPSSQSKKNQIDIGVLDSSFNPPHKAHIGLANSVKPQFEDDETANGENSNQYDSILLLFSVRNADKGLGTSKDAAPIQRLDMMKLMANELENHQIKKNVAVGIIEEPLMISKSSLIHEFIRENQQKEQNPKQSPTVRLHWLVGFDTLERFFQVKYYPSPEFFHKACEKFFKLERTTFVCARRGIDSLPNKEKQNNEKEGENKNTRDDRKVENDFLKDDLVKPWKDCGSIQMIDLPKSIQSVSSTAIRKTIQQNETSNDDLKNKLSQLSIPSIAEYLIKEGIYKE